MTESQDNCSPALLDTLDTECTDIHNEKDQVTLPRYYKLCVVAKIWSDLLNMTSSSSILTVPANESTPSKEPGNLSLNPVGNGSLEISWTAPPTESWNGLPQDYSVNVSVGDVVVYSTRVLAQSPNSLVYQDYNHSLTYTITVSACTRVGCGPTASRTVSSSEFFTISTPFSVKLNLCLSDIGSSSTDDIQLETDEPETDQPQPASGNGT